MSADPASILGEPAASHIPILVDVLDDLGDHEYDFMSAANYDIVLHKDVQEAQRIYWLEILYRAHFAAATSLIRTSRWIDAMLRLAEDSNYTVFMAAYRGCLESAADSFHTFGSVPGWLADAHSAIRLAVVGKAEQMTLFPALEDELIHFTHAGHVPKGEHVDPVHRAKQTTEYLRELSEYGTPEVMATYRTLCDVTHPGAGSIRCHADAYGTDAGTAYRLSLDLDDELIEAFCKESETVSERMIYYGVVPAIMTLRILNDFGVKQVFTPGVTKIGVERHPAWESFAKRLNDPRPPEGRPPDFGTKK